MSSKRVLLVASAVILLAVPAISLAQENQNNSAESEQKSGRQQDQGRDTQGTQQDRARPQGQARSQEQGTQHNQPRSQDQRRSPEQAVQPSQATISRPDSDHQGKARSKTEPDRRAKPDLKTNADHQGKAHSRARPDLRIKANHEAAKPPKIDQPMQLGTSSRELNGVPAMRTGTETRLGSATRTGGARARSLGVTQAPDLTFSLRPAMATTACRRRIGASAGPLGHSCQAIS